MHGSSKGHKNTENRFGAVVEKVMRDYFDET